MDLTGDDGNDGGEDGEGDLMEEIDDDNDDDEDFLHTTKATRAAPTSRRPNSSANPGRPDHSRTGLHDDSVQGGGEGTVNPRRVVLIEDPPHLSSGSASLSSNKEGEWSSSSSSSESSSSSLAQMLCSFRDPVILIIR